MTTSYRLSGTFWLLLIPALLISGHSYGYPIDAYEDTGIRRLDYYRLAQTGEIEGKKLHEGAKLNSADIVPRLSGQAPNDSLKSRALQYCRTGSQQSR